MDTSRERDESVERLLRQSLKAPRQADATELCLDAETLAAWVDGGLTGPALEMAQSHVADCGRCQSLVGAMARASSALPPPEAERARRPWLAWLVPITAVAAAVTLWVAVPRERYTSAPPAPSATDQVTTEEKSQAAPSSAVPSPAAPPEAPPPAAQTRTSSASTLDRPVSPAPELRRDSGRLEADALKEEQKVAQPAAPPSAAPATAGAIAGAPPQPARQAAAAEVLADGARSANVSQAAQACTPAWSAAPADLARQLTAGASPVASVCWLVGRGGVVIVSIDTGRTWRRVTFPEITDLSAVQATDARAASITTADGRIFSTSDGGGTWVRR